MSIEIKISYIPPTSDRRGRTSATKRLTMQELSRAPNPRQFVADIAVALMDSVKDLDLTVGKGRILR